MRHCQVVEYRQKELCPAQESGGIHCERIPGHEGPHRVSQHTIDHSTGGNGWSCGSFSSPPPFMPWLAR